MATYRVDPERVIGDGSVEDGTTWETAYQSLIYILDNIATTGDIILVRAGRIVIDLPDIIEIPENVTVYGGMPPAHVVVDDDWFDEDDPTHRNLECWVTVIDGMADARCIHSIGEGATIDGFWMRNGYISTNNGGGMYINSNDVTLENCWFTNCEASAASNRRGGGIYITGATGVVVENCEFGLCNARSGAGVYITSSSSVTFCRNKFSGCDATVSGGAIFIDDTISPHVILKQTIIDHCTAGTTAGGGICNNSLGIVEIDSCTIMDCETGGYGGGVYNYVTSALANIYNSLIRGNSADTSGDQLYGYTVCQYSNVQGGAAGTGNIDTAPNWRDEGWHPYEPISTTGNCDAANSGTTYWESLDFRSRSRYDDPDQTPNTGTGSPDYSDIGAYEYIGDVQAYITDDKFLVDYVGSDSDYYTTSTSKGGSYYHYFVMRAPEAPKWWRDSPQLQNMKFEFQREVYIDNTSSYMEINLTIGGVNVLNRDNIQPSPAHTAPEWEEDIDNQYNRGSEDYAAIMSSYPSDVKNCSMMAEEHNLQYLIAVVEVRFLAPAYTDDIEAYNFWFEPVHDDTDARYDYGFKLAIHNGETVLDRFDPDMPMSSYLVKEVVMESLMKMQYELYSPMSIPIYGKYYQSRNIS